MPTVCVVEAAKRRNTQSIRIALRLPIREPKLHLAPIDRTIVKLLPAPLVKLHQPAACQDQERVRTTRPFPPVFRWGQSNSVLSRYLPRRNLHWCTFCPSPSCMMPTRTSTIRRQLQCRKMFVAILLEFPSTAPVSMFCKRMPPFLSPETKPDGYRRPRCTACRTILKHSPACPVPTSTPVACHGFQPITCAHRV